MTQLKAPHMERCIGCFLCVLATSRRKGEISLQDSAIRIVRGKGFSFKAEIDPLAEVGSEIKEICPRNCLSLE